MPNPVTHWQMLTHDPEASARFYGDLFDWTITDENALGYKTAQTGGADGGFWPIPQDAPQAVQLFIQVSDIDQYVAQAESLGATVIIPPQKLPEGDELAILLDPFGFPFGLTTGMNHLRANPK
jgi:predicted enzyme related to lactoylglutathione lyase